MNKEAWYLRLDAQVLLWCTKFAHWFQRLTGRTSFFIAKIGIGMSIWAMFVSIMNYWVPLLAHKTTWGTVAVRSFLLLGFLLDSIRCNKAEERLLNGYVALPHWVKLQRSIIGPMWRLLGLFVTVLVIGVVFGIELRKLPWSIMRWEIIEAGFGPGFAIFMYFIHVDPLPPGTSKIREWIAGFGFGPKKVMVEN